MKTKKMLLLTSLISSVLITGCVGDSNNPNTQQKQSNLNNKQVMYKSLNGANDSTENSYYKLGDPSLVNLRETLANRDSCLNLAMDAQISPGAAEAKKSLKSMVSVNEILDEMGIDGSLKGGYKDYKGKIAGKFEDLKNTTSQQIQYAYSGRASIKMALKNIDTGSKTFELDQCGDSYAIEVDYGIYVGTVINLTFKTSTIKQLIEASGEINAASFAELAGSLKKLNKNYTKDATVSITTTQLGGNLSEFYKDFKPKDGELVSEYKCNLESPDECIKILNSLNYYMNTSFSSQIDSLLIKKLKDEQFKTLDDLKGLWGMNISRYRSYNSSTPYVVPADVSSELSYAEILFNTA